MSIPTLQECKAHLRILHEHEDALILGYLEAAVSSAEATTRRDFTSEEGEEMPPAVKQAVLLLLAHFYEHRQAATVGKLEELPFAVRYLLWPNRRNLYTLGRT